MGRDGGLGKHDKNTLYKILKELKELENLQVNRVKRYIKFMLHSDLGMVA